MRAIVIRDYETEIPYSDFEQTISYIINSSYSKDDIAKLVKKVFDTLLSTQFENLVIDVYNERLRDYVLFYVGLFLFTCPSTSIYIISTDFRREQIKIWGLE